MSYLVPIRLARDAYLADEIDVETFEACLEASYSRREVVIPLPLQSRAYEHLQRMVRFSGSSMQPLGSVFFLAELD